MSGVRLGGGSLNAVSQKPDLNLRSLRRRIRDHQAAINAKF